MKTKLLSLLLILTSIHSSFGFYDPNIGRWISRDPLSDEAFIKPYLKGKSFEEVAKIKKVSLMPPYLFVNNDPIDFWDLFGLLDSSDLAAMPPDLKKMILTALADTLADSELKERGGAIYKKGNLWRKRNGDPQIGTPAEKDIAGNFKESDLTIEFESSVNIFRLFPPGIVGCPTFFLWHTHPLAGSAATQPPSEKDKTTTRSLGIPGVVVSKGQVYIIDPKGTVDEVGAPENIFK